MILAESVFARCLSAIKSDREEASKSLLGPENTKYEGDKAEFIEDIRQVIFFYFNVMLLVLFAVNMVINLCYSFLFYNQNILVLERLF